jgi:arylesterase/paraoxonase
MMATATPGAVINGNDKAKGKTLLFSLYYYLPVLAIAILASIYRQPASILSLVGRVEIDPASITQWANSSGLNNEGCQVNYAANACEDVAIHFPSNTAFLACGDPVGRTHWYPPACVRGASKRAEATFRESIFKYNIRNKETTELKIEGLEGDFVNHGIDIYNFPNDPKRIHLFAVKHTRDGDSIAIFSHVIGSNVLTLVNDVKHPNIKNANGVVATGPL